MSTPKSKVSVFDTTGRFMSYCQVKRAELLASRGVMDLRPDGSAILLLTKEERKARRIRVIEGAKGICYLCGEKAVEPTLDHIIPLARYGLDLEYNLGCSCKACNNLKDDLMYHEYLALKIMLLNLEECGWDVNIRSEVLKVGKFEYRPELYIPEKKMYVDIKAGFDARFRKVMLKARELFPDCDIQPVTPSKMIGWALPASY